MTYTLKLLATFTLAAATTSAFAAKEAGCVNGGFTLAANVDTNGIAVANIPTTIKVVGKYVEFDVDSATLGIRNFTLTGAPAADRLTTTPLVVFASKSPDLRGLTLTSDVTVQNSGGTLLIARSGPGIDIKIQALDCSSGGIFQLEAERADLTATDFTHILGPNIYYFNNPNFGPPPPPLPLCPAGGPFTPSCTPVPITPRVNMAADGFPLFVGRDSAQDSTKIHQSGGTSVWRVASGGRMGAVLGEDSVEVAPPPSTCLSHCQAQDQGKGRYPVLGFPSPVPANSRILPR
ncbi:hypothetical protein [Granulicella arctica]|uniref:hypothetical protein n=1 Tax=Granulicella arctica TaxID=940613 RepID=UPI0021DFB6F9|nr:hypothetical protein [Granulicella arctica]